MRVNNYRPLRKMTRIIAPILTLISLSIMHQPFPFEKLIVKSIFYEFTQEIEDEQDAEFELVIEFEPFEVEGEEHELRLEFVGFSNPVLEKHVFSDGFVFSEDDELEPSSIYLQSVHNPIDLKKLKINREGDNETFEIELFFDFEYERTDYKSHTFTINHQQDENDK